DEGMELTLDDAGETVMETITGIVESFLAQLPLIVAGILILVLTAIVASVARRIADRLLRGVRLRDSLKELISRFVVITFWTMGLMVSAMVTFPGLTPTKALTALGIGSVAVGLAFKDIFENFFAGVLILWRFPFENGDFIECNGQVGRVEDVTVRNTMIRTVRGELVVIPNATIYKNSVEVLTSRAKRRMDIIAGVAYGEDVAESRAVIAEAVESCKSVSKDHEVEVYACEFASSSINFEVTWWTGATPKEQRASRDEVIEAIKSALDSAGNEIPFQYRTLTFKDEGLTGAIKEGFGDRSDARD
ncbi:MAG: mechanosensitive ion channel family protein, partial [Phycisphaerales bacterium]